MTLPVIHRVTQLDLKFQPGPWPFADERRAGIDAHFAVKQREKPKIWNGRSCWRATRFSPPTASAPLIPMSISQASWRGGLGFSRQGRVQRLRMGALRCSDGAFVLGEMSQHTANAGASTSHRNA